MSGDFFVQDFNILLFVIVAGGLALLMSGCFFYYKWKRVQSKSKNHVPQKTKHRLKKFLRRASGASDRQARDEMARENAAASAQGDNDIDNPAFSTVDEMRTQTGSMS